MLQDWSQFSQLGVTNNNFGNSYRQGLGIEIFLLLIIFPFGNNDIQIRWILRKSYYKVNGQDLTGFGQGSRS